MTQEKKLNELEHYKMLYELADIQLSEKTKLILELQTQIESFKKYNKDLWSTFIKKYSEKVPPEFEKTFKENIDDILA